jgi:formate-dependent phosphoribosylglycinamide formyltransferase (GAR transformylase)
MPQCIVPGCSAEGVNNLGLRLRRPNTSAIWAPNTTAFVCNQHAVTGARITVVFEPTATHHVDVHVYGATHREDRRTAIKLPVEETVEDALTARVRSAGQIEVEHAD